MPQRRGDVPDRHARKLVESMAAWKAALIQRDAAIVAALKAGASTHQVAAITGLAQSTVHGIGKAGGWPTEAQRSEWDERKRQNDEWRAWVDEAVERLLKERPTEF